MIDSPRGSSRVCCPEKVIKSWVPPLKRGHDLKNPWCFFLVWFVCCVDLFDVFSSFFYRKNEESDIMLLNRRCFRKKQHQLKWTFERCNEDYCDATFARTVLSVINWKFLDDLNILPWCGSIFSFFWGPGPTELFLWRGHVPDCSSILFSALFKDAASGGRCKDVLFSLKESGIRIKSRILH